QTSRANLRRGSQEETDAVILSEKERDEIKAESAAASNMGPMNVNTKEEEFERRSPKMTAALKKKLVIVERKLANVDENGHKFVREAGDTILKGLFVILRMDKGGDLDMMKYVGEIGKTVKKPDEFYGTGQ
ncbi:hypothetical protein PMAYCL1PPCAC_15815, partial [Pristionchus mayeri]